MNSSRETSTICTGDVFLCARASLSAPCSLLDRLELSARRPSDIAVMILLSEVERSRHNGLFELTRWYSGTVTPGGEVIRGNELHRFRSRVRLHRFRNEVHNWIVCLCQPDWLLVQAQGLDEDHQATTAQATGPKILAGCWLTRLALYSCVRFSSPRSPYRWFSLNSRNPFWGFRCSCLHWACHWTNCSHENHKRLPPLLMIGSTRPQCETRATLSDFSDHWGCQPVFGHISSRSSLCLTLACACASLIFLDLLTAQYASRQWV